MDCSELYNAACAFVSNRAILGGLDITIGKLIVTRPIGNSKNADLRQLGLRDASGIYFLLRPSYDVTYIGKATKQNLHQELWGKLGTPIGKVLPYKYPNTYWSEMDLEPEISSEIIQGQILVAAFDVNPSSCCSLIEVYLQTLCSKNGGLPCLNSQIG